jgi:phosphoribosylanthranilate isomerase
MPRELNPANGELIMKLKICGIRTAEDAEALNGTGIDFAGFVFVSGHRQEVSVERARELRAALDPEIKTVGVFVNEPYEFIKYLTDEKIIDAVQFHGESEYGLPVPTIKGMVIRGKEDIKPTDCDMVVFDGHKDGVVGSSGGTFDWRLVEGYKEKPFFLAGGINIDNIEKAMAHKPYGIDLSSGAEEGGKKSREKITEVVYAIRYGKVR